MQVPVQEPQRAPVALVQQPAPEGDDVLPARLPERRVPRPPHPPHQDREAEGRGDGDNAAGSRYEPQGEGSCKTQSLFNCRAIKTLPPPSSLLAVGTFFSSSFLVEVYTKGIEPRSTKNMSFFARRCFGSFFYVTLMVSDKKIQ